MNPQAPRVFVTQRPVPHPVHGWMPDLTTAGMYGALEYVFEPSEKVHHLPGPAFRKASEVLAGFRFDKDFVLWPNTGNPISVYLVLAALLRRGPSELKVLVYQRSFRSAAEAEGGGSRTGAYMPVTLFF